MRQAEGDGRQGPWVKGYRLGDYRGTVHRDGVGALIDVVRGSATPVTLICIGPAPNIQAALARAPDIAARARLVGMFGSVRAGYGGRPTPEAEWNVKSDPGACRAALGAGWSPTITPLDTCSLVRLTGGKYRRVRDATNPLAKAVIENYRLWYPSAEWLPRDAPDLPERESTVLFDTVAVYLAFAEDLLEIEPLGLRVSDDGRTLIDPASPKVRCATRWRDLGAFEDLLLARLVGP
jgi:inosine-uridine nucleoside N-ribohydrolase